MCLLRWCSVMARTVAEFPPALLHVMGDLLGSVAALIAGAVIHYTGWTPIDPLLSVLVAALILLSTINLLRHALHALLNGVPQGLVSGGDWPESGGLPGCCPCTIYMSGRWAVSVLRCPRICGCRRWSNGRRYWLTRAMLHRDYGDLSLPCSRKPIPNSIPASS